MEASLYVIAREFLLTCVVLGRHVKILLAHPRLGRGGSEVVTAWIAEALAVEHDVTIVTTGQLGLRELDMHAGTSLQDKSVELTHVNSLAVLGNLQRASALRGAHFARSVRHMVQEYDLLISGYEFMPFGRPGIHYIHGDSPEIRGVAYEDGDRSRLRLHVKRVLRKMYLKYSQFVLGQSAKRPTESDLLVANSYYTAQNVARTWNRPARIVYPPVVDVGSSRAWSMKSDTFVML